MTEMYVYFYRLLEISIHILHTKDDAKKPKLDDMDEISIHILHTKDDDCPFELAQPILNFNPHPSHEG